MIFSLCEQALIALPLILGAYLTLSLLKLPDFSIESSYLFGAVAAFLARDLPLPFVLLSSIGGGMLVGAVVCILNHYCRIPFLLAAIITNGFVHGMTQYVLGTSVTSFHLTLPIAESTLLVSVGLTLALLIGLCMRSQLGYSLAIYGNNPRFFQCHPISGCYVLFAGVIVGHGCAGMSGFLFAQSNGFVDLTMNFGIILLCLTSLMLGKMFSRSSYPTILVPLLGVFAFFFIQQSLLRWGLNLKYFNAFQALFVLGILLMKRRKESFQLDHLGV